MSVPTIGRIVLYTLTDADADLIGQARPAGTVAGNPVAEGEQYPAVVVRVFGDPHVNLQVLLDGGDSYWATSRGEGTGPGTWCWPPRVGAGS